MRTTRREALGMIGAVGLAPLANSIERAQPTERSFSFAYFSDTHLGIGRNESECVAMAEEMRAWSPAFGINGGDVTDYGWPEEFDAYDRVLQAFGFEVAHVPGNHDVRWSGQGVQIFRERLGQEFSSFDHGGCRFCVLDSTVPLSHWGHYELRQLEWLESRLKEVGRETPVFLATHHWVGRDRVMIDNEREFLGLIAPYNVKVLLTGHGHSDLLWESDGAPSVMNKGLYQGSWMKIDVDFGASEVRVGRRTAESALAPVTSIPLARTERSSAPFVVPIRLIRAGGEVRVEGVAEHRWNDGAWSTEARISSDGLSQGTHDLQLRREVGGPSQQFPIEIEPPTNRLLWRTPLTGGVMSHLVVRDGELFASAMDGSVWKIRASDGRPIWKAETDLYCHGTPWVHADLVFVGSADAHVYAFDRSDGHLVWKRRCGGPVYSGCAAVGSVVFASAGDGKLYGFEAMSGRPVFERQLPGEANKSWSQSNLAADALGVVLTTWDNTVLSYGLDGELQWSAGACADMSFAYSPAIGSPLIADGRVFAVANGNRLYCYDRQTGAELWRMEAPGDKFGHSSPRWSDGRIYVGGLGDQGAFYCVNPETQSIEWTHETGETIYDSSPTVGRGVVAIGSVNSLLTVVDQTTGEHAWSARLPTGHFLSSPAIADGTLYAASFGNHVEAYRLV